MKRKFKLKHGEIRVGTGVIFEKTKKGYKGRFDGGDWIGLPAWMVENSNDLFEEIVEDFYGPSPLEEEIKQQDLDNKKNYSRREKQAKRKMERIEEIYGPEVKPKKIEKLPDSIYRDTYSNDIDLASIQMRDDRRGAISQNRGKINELIELLTNEPRNN